METFNFEPLDHVDTLIFMSYLRPTNKETSDAMMNVYLDQGYQGVKMGLTRLFNLDEDELPQSLIDFKPVARTLLEQTPSKCAQVVSDGENEINYVTPQEYSSNLKELGNQMPWILYTKGDKSLVTSDDDSITVVGSRTAPQQAREYAYSLGKVCAKQDLIIFSGGAYGVDTSVEEGALNHNGRVVSVEATGLDQFYPVKNKDTVASQVEKQGLRVSEIPVGIPFANYNFLERNRIVSAASDATVVVAAGWRSGALSTAVKAEQKGRLLAAVDYDNPQFWNAGNQKLIESGQAMPLTYSAGTAGAMEKINAKMNDVWRESRSAFTSGNLATKIDDSLITQQTAETQTQRVVR
jgi:DNA protecting protein DprA